MAYEAFANVMANIGRGIEARAAENRARENRLADVASERAYADQVRQEQFDKQLELTQRQADIALKAEVKRVRALAGAQLLAEAETMGIPVTGIDGQPRDVAEIRAAIISRREAEAAQAALAGARANAAAATDKQVLDAQAVAARAGAEAQLDTRAALAPRAQEVADLENTRSKEVFQKQLTDVDARLAPLLSTLQSNPAAGALMGAMDSVRSKVEQALNSLGTPAQQDERLRAMGISPAAVAAARNGDLVQLEQVGRALGVSVDSDATLKLAKSQADAQSWSAVQLAAPLLTERSRILSDARSRGIDLAFASAAPAAAAPATSSAAAPTPKPFALPARAPAPVAPVAAATGMSNYFTPPAPALNRPESRARANEAIGDSMRGLGYGVSNFFRPSAWYPGSQVGSDAVVAYRPERSPAYLDQLKSRYASLTDKNSPTALSLAQEIQTLAPTPSTPGSFSGAGRGFWQP